MKLQTIKENKKIQLKQEGEQISREYYRKSRALHKNGEAILPQVNNI